MNHLKSLARDETKRASRELQRSISDAAEDQAEETAQIREQFNGMAATLRRMMGDFEMMKQQKKEVDIATRAAQEEATKAVALAQQAAVACLHALASGTIA